MCLTQSGLLRKIPRSQVRTDEKKPNKELGEESFNKTKQKTQQNPKSAMPDGMAF